MSTTRVRTPRDGPRPAGARPNSEAGRSESGQALVEFALVLPIVLVVLLGIAYFGLALNGWIDETHIVSEGARLAETNNTCFPNSGSPIEVEGTFKAGALTEVQEVTSFSGIRVGAELSDSETGKVIPAGTIVSSFNEATKRIVMTAPATGAHAKEKIKVIGKSQSPHACELGVREEGEFLTWLTAQGDSSQVRGATATICSPTSKLHDYVEVKLTYNYKWLPILKLKVAETPVTSTAQMTIEKEPATPYPTCPA